jgi:hypothetical protein
MNKQVVRWVFPGIFLMGVFSGPQVQAESGAPAMDEGEVMMIGPNDAPPGQPGGEQEPTLPRDESDRVSGAISAAKNASDQDALVGALRNLGQFQDSRTVEVLLPALKSETPEVRMAALEAMRWGTVSDSNALEEVRYLAEREPDPMVRGAALEVLVRYDTTDEGRKLLERLTEESEADIRDFAREHLNRMDAEARTALGAENGQNQ